jgi:AcrR family transcriptional regulator
MHMHDHAAVRRGDVGEAAQPLSLRERKKRLAQATIEETALRLFQEQGYEQTSIQDIADAVLMSPRTFFRYFASKEEVLIGPMRTSYGDALCVLRNVAPAASAHTALRAIIDELARLYQQQRARLLIRYQVAFRTPSVVPMYLFALTGAEPAICDALCSYLEGATDRDEIRFLVALYMAAFRVAAEKWLERGATGDLVSMLRGYLDRLSSLPPLHQHGGG